MAGLDGEVVEVGVVVDLDGGDGLGLVPAGFGVVGGDLVAGFEGADGLVLPPGSRTRVAAVNDSPPSSHDDLLPPPSLPRCRRRRATTIALDAVYSAPNSERDDVVTAVPGQSAAAIFDKYIAALGGAQRLAGSPAISRPEKALDTRAWAAKVNSTFTRKPPIRRPPRLVTRIIPSAGPAFGPSTAALAGLGRRADC